ncbi:MAG: GIY-YIG nuclease family protein [Gemmatales bacterium]
MITRGKIHEPQGAVQAYKETRRPMGIFCVKNTKTGQVLLGSSVDLPGMLNRQRWQLEMGGHPNKALQHDWNTLGPAAFTIEVLDTLSAPEDADYQPADDLKELLEMWMEKLSPYEQRGYHGRRVVK